MAYIYTTTDIDTLIDQAKPKPGTPEHAALLRVADTRRRHKQAGGSGFVLPTAQVEAMKAQEARRKRRRERYRAKVAAAREAKR